jgi:hypothetical protein
MIQHALQMEAIDTHRPSIPSTPCPFQALESQYMDCHHGGHILYDEVSR